MKKFLKKWRIAIVSFAYASILVSLVFFVIMPLLKALEEKADYIKQTMVDRDNRQKRLGELPRIREQIEYVSAHENELSIRFTRDKAVTLIEELEQLAQQTNNEITISMVDDGKSTAKGKAPDAKSKDVQDIVANLPSNEYIRMKLKLKGSYNDFMNFIWKLENMRYFSDVVTLQVAAGSDTGSVSNNSFVETNPFAGIEKKTASINIGQKVDSILDVVFYLQKNNQ